MADDAMTFSVSDLPGEHGLASMTFALHLRTGRDVAPFPIGSRVLALNFQTRRASEAPERCPDVIVYVDGQPLSSRLIDASVVQATPHDDGIAMTSIHLDGALDVSGASCIEILACGASYPLPAGAGVELMRLVSAR